MGLDIFLCKILSKEEATDDTAFFVVNDNTFDSFVTHDFGGKIYSKENEYYHYGMYWGDKAQEYDIAWIDYGKTLDDGCVCYRHKASGEYTKVKLKDIPIIKQTDSIVYYEHVGYQRKGLTDEWYDAYRNGHFRYFAFALDVLAEILDKYCEEDYKAHFKQNIIDNFKEGEHVVTFDW